MIIEQGTIDDILNIDAQIPELDAKTTRDKLVSRLASVPHLILLAKVDGATVGYKAGYEVNDTEFYSWLGGVIPAFRKQGIATALRKHQESWAKEARYTSISVKSMNRYMNMVQLLLSSGYKIVGYEAGQSLYGGKIKFHKHLKEPSANNSSVWQDTE